VSAQLACTTADLAPAEALRADLRDASGALVEVAVVRDGDGGWHAISDICSHGQVSLSDGEIEGCYVECWLHGSMFDLRTGQPTALPAIRPVPVYPVTIDGEQVLVDVDAPVN
jgi:3-phenylpropionate/trans-cinnamate dioxygenase ferredoxin subunit